LKFSVGSADDATFSASFDETELLITGAQRCDELRHFLVTVQAMKAFDGLERAAILSLSEIRYAVLCLGRAARRLATASSCVQRRRAERLRL
jgi:hypothetical protein